MFTYLQNGYQDATAESSSERIQDLMTQLARQGLNTSLRALQVWADLARQLGPQVLGSSTDATRVFLASDYDLFSKLLAAQRDTVEELDINYRELSQRYLDLR